MVIGGWLVMASIMIIHVFYSVRGHGEPLCQIFKNRTSRRSADVTFGHHVKARLEVSSGAHVAQTVHDFVIVVRLAAAELIARKRQYR